MLRSFLQIPLGVVSCVDGLAGLLAKQWRPDFAPHLRRGERKRAAYEVMPVFQAKGLGSESYVSGER